MIKKAKPCVIGVFFAHNDIIIERNSIADELEKIIKKSEEYDYPCLALKMISKELRK